MLDAAAVVVAVCLEEDDGKKIKRKYENKKSFSISQNNTFIFIRFLCDEKCGGLA